MIRKTAVVTGASGGIGRAIAINLAKQGYNLAITYNQHSTEMLEEEIRKIGVEVLSIKMDIRNSDEIINGFQIINNYFKRIDVVICNAGIAEEEYMLIDKSENDINNVLDVNLRGTILCNKEALKYMIPQRNGAIVNISSILGIVGCSCEVAYSASKAGIIGLTKSLSKEVGQFGIRVNAVAPGVINTNMMAGFSKEEVDQLIKNTTLQRVGQPEDVANVVSFLASKDSSFITGECIEVSGGLLI